MDRWTEFELFVQTAELGSLSKAAEQLDMSNATASCDVSIGCSPEWVWETGVTTLQDRRGIPPDEQP